MTDQPLIINDWKDGMADSAHLGTGLLKNVDIESFPGALIAGKLPTTLFQTAFSVNFTADASTDVITMTTGSAPVTGTAVTVSNSGGALPTPLAASTNYFVIKVSTNTFKLATTIANANANTPINITDAGTGTHTVTTVNPGTINHIVKSSSSGLYFMQDSNARVWYVSGSIAYLLNGNTRTNGEGNGIVAFKNSDASAEYLFVFRNAVVDVVEITGTTNVENPSWTSGWQNLNSGAGSGNPHYAMVGQDNIIYFVDGRFVGSIRELTVFVPGTGATYTYNNQALDMPQGEINSWLEELGALLLISGQTYDKIYPWDRVSDSYNLPLVVPEKAVYRIKNVGSVIYILAGTEGNIYTTQGTYVRNFKKLPYYAFNNAADILSNPITWGGIAARNGALLFGVSSQTTGNAGVCLLYPDGRLIIDNQPSTGSGKVTALYTDNDLYTMGYASGADTFSTLTRYASYNGVVQTRLYKVATKTQKGQYSELEVQIARPVSTGHIRIKYRTNSNASTSFSDFPGEAVAMTADGSTTSWSFDIGLIDIENLQLQIEIDGNMELMEVRLIP